jgi:pantetheine hydrolase
MQSNLDHYENFTAEAAEQGAQVVVFPEDGLYGAFFLNRSMILPYLEEIPEPSSQSLCTKQWIRSPALHRLSCLSQRYNVLLVADMGEIVYCSGARCPRDGHFNYNTQVAFDRGALVAKYHKSHLYKEPQWNPQKPPTPAVYHSKRLNVTFGFLICFDIMFLGSQFACCCFSLFLIEFGRASVDDDA